MQDYQYWRQEALGNPRRVGGSKWNRELTALSSLYTWASRRANGFITDSPIETQPVLGRYGGLVRAAVLRAKDAKGSNVHWLTPRAFRRWVDVGLRGYGRAGLPPMRQIRPGSSWSTPSLRKAQV
ncbi:hypothetical protein ACFWC9_41090 [Streptomyces goshikiensis]|uniref:hypothetical protein n=1 Tax=Streptomyces goshikiensis TaxID=1942 RepID=UPI0036A0EB98